jgi:hypothetical protein
MLDWSPAQVRQALPVAFPANDTARYLAGMEPTDPTLKDLTRYEAWQRHAKFFDNAWMSTVNA